MPNFAPVAVSKTVSPKPYAQVPKKAKKVQYRFDFCGNPLPTTEFLSKLEEFLGGEKLFASCFRSMWINTTYKWNENIELEPSNSVAMIFYCDEEKATELTTYLAAEGFSVSVRKNPYKPQISQ